MLSHLQNKKNMCEVFCKRVQVQLEVSGKRFMIIHRTDINWNISDWTVTRHDHQEADCCCASTTSWFSCQNYVRLDPWHSVWYLQTQTFSCWLYTWCLSCPASTLSLNNWLVRVERWCWQKLAHLLVTAFWEYIYILRLHGSIQSNYEGKSPQHIYPHERWYGHSICILWFWRKYRNNLGGEFFIIEVHHPTVSEETGRQGEVRRSCGYRQIALETFY